MRVTTGKVVEGKVVVEGLPLQEAAHVTVLARKSEETPEAIPLTHTQREELDRRLDELDREGPVGIPAEEVLGRLHTRRA